MNKTVGVILLVLVVGSFVIFGFPIEKNDTPKSIETKTSDNIKTEVLEKTTKQVTSELSTQAITTACKDPNSQECFTTTSTTSILNAIITLFFIVLAIAGVLYLIKLIVPIIGSILDIF